jgi:nitroreductase
MEFEEIVKQRYAARMFDGKNIPEAKIEKLFDMIRYSASSFNLQPWKVEVITDNKIKEKLMPASGNQLQVKTCSHLLVFCAYKDPTKRLDELKSEMIKSGADENRIKPYLEMISKALKKMSQKEKVDWAERQVYLALSNALNGAKSLGFDSCPLEGFDPKEYQKILELPDYLVPVVLCPVGYGADKPRPKFRFSTDKVFFN